MPGNDALTGPPVTTILELLARMAAIDAALPPTDGLACFNRMYRRITELVRAQLGAAFFADPAFMNHLDVVFGNLYLAAVNAAVEQPDQVPRAWDALLERRADTRIAALQFAMAGMNAHINHDLPIAVVTTCEDFGTSPEAGSHHEDYERVNTVLAAAEREVREEFEDAALREADETLPVVGDVTVNFNLVVARETAWANALTLWTLHRISAALEAAYMDGLDHLVGFAGRGLLVRLKL